MKKIAEIVCLYFNPCGLYIWLWMLYYLQGVLYPRGSVLSYLSLFLILLFSFINLYKFVRRLGKERQINSLFFLFVLFSIYGVVNFLGSDVLKVNGMPYSKLDYLKDIYLSLLPVFSFYIYAKGGSLSPKLIKAFFILFLSVVILKYYNYRMTIITELVMKGGNEESEITNNIGYVFISLIPLLVFFNRTLLRYILLFIILLFTLFCIKRGAILIGLIASLYLIVKTFSFSSKKARKGIIVATAVLCCVSSYFFFQFIENSDYFNERLLNTLDGDTNGRSDLSNIFLRHYFFDYNFFEQLLGQGADSTLRYEGLYAHNDWIEILMNQGLFGVLMYFYYWACYYFNLRSTDKSKNIHTIIGLSLIICFMKSLFSMSYSDMDIFLAISMGWSCAHVHKIKKQ